MPHAAFRTVDAYPLPVGPIAPLDASPPDRDLLDAVITVAAFVAKADGWVDGSEREALYRFVVDMGFDPAPSRAEIIDMFEQRIRELRAPGDAIALERLLTRAADCGPGPMVKVGERVAHADGLLDPRERRILDAIKTMLMATRRVEIQRSKPHAPRG